MALEYAKSELKSARESLELMKNSKTMYEFEKNWKAFLNYIEKVWNKSERECQDFKEKFEPWQGKIKRKRKKDLLLRYLKHARHADEHTINEIVERKNSAMLINPPDSNGKIYIKKMIIKDGGLAHYEGSPIKISFIPAKVKAVTFKNDDVTFSIPTEHQGIPIKNNNDPMELASLGLKFYSSYLEEIERKFFN